MSADQLIRSDQLISFPEYCPDYCCRNFNVLILSTMCLTFSLSSCRLKWQSGSPFAKIFDAAPTSVNASQFLRIDGHDLVIDCKRCLLFGELEMLYSGLFMGKICL